MRKVPLSNRSVAKFQELQDIKYIFYEPYGGGDTSIVCENANLTNGFLRCERKDYKVIFENALRFSSVLSAKGYCKKLRGLGYMGELKVYSMRKVALELEKGGYFG